MSIGFCVIYRFRIREGSEDEFRQGWSRLTEAIRETRGGLGSRLHLAEDGWWVAYAQWPDREQWERARKEEPADDEAARMMRSSIVESRPPILLDPLVDLLAEPTDSNRP